MHGCAQLMDGPWPHDHRRDPRPVAHPRECDLRGRHVEPLCRGNNALDHAAPTVVEEAANAGSEDLGCAARVRGRAVAVLAREHAAAERGAGEDPEVMGARPGQDYDAYVKGMLGGLRMMRRTGIR